MESGEIGQSGLSVQDIVEKEREHDPATVTHRHQHTRETTARETTPKLKHANIIYPVSYQSICLYRFNQSLDIHPNGSNLITAGGI